MIKKSFCLSLQAAEPKKKRMNLVCTPEMVEAAIEKTKKRFESYIPTLRELKETETFDKAADRNLLLKINMSYFNHSGYPMDLRQKYRQEVRSTTSMWLIV